MRVRVRMRVRAKVRVRVMVRVKGRIARVDAGGLGEASGEVAAVVSHPSRPMVLQVREGLELTDRARLPRVVLGLGRG